MAAVLGFRDVTIATVGMEHYQAARNTVKSVVDCYIHVDRCMLKRSDYIPTAREHIRMLAKITDREIFQRGAGTLS
jgi:hypothetical protein